jgi:hypothetical protein
VNDEVIKLVAERIEKGKEKYPDEIPDDDNRDFLQEALEEALDMSVYLSGEILRLKKWKKKILSKEHKKDDDGKDVFKNLFGKDY